MVVPRFVRPGRATRRAEPALRKVRVGSSPRCLAAVSPGAGCIFVLCSAINCFRWRDRSLDSPVVLLLRIQRNATGFRIDSFRVISLPDPLPAPVHNEGCTQNVAVADPTQPDNIPDDQLSTPVKDILGPEKVAHLPSTTTTKTNERGASTTSPANASNLDDFSDADSHSSSHGQQAKKPRVSRRLKMQTVSQDE
ncbi:hypothetical protein ACP4OV_024648 [Aristida adscensionis]